MRSTRELFSGLALWLGLAAIGCTFEGSGPACSQPVERRCRCATAEGLVEMCVANDWVPVGCTCVAAAGTGAGAHADAAVEDDEHVPLENETASPSEAALQAGAMSQRIGELGVAATPRDAASYLFDETQVRAYDILIDEADLAAIDARPSAEAWVPARLAFEGHVYGPYRVRYKGGLGSFRYPCTSGGADDPKAGKCSLKLDFNDVDPDARFFGLKKLNLHSMNMDPSLMRDRLGYALFREHGVAAPRAVHARVSINGRLEGVFIAVEQIDGRFTRARFGDGGEGNLYKEVWPVYTDPGEYLYALETNEDEDPSVQRMLEWSAALTTGAADLGSFVDLAYLARYMAVDRVIVNDDGALHFYCDSSLGSAGVNHNYYWYQAGERFWLIPWDMDYAFDGSAWVRLRPAWNVDAPCTCVGSELGAQVPASCDPLVRQLLGRQDAYEREVDAFLAGPFSAKRVDAHLDVWTEQLRGLVAESIGIYDGPNEAEWAEALDALKRTIAATREARGLRF